MNKNLILSVLSYFFSVTFVGAQSAEDLYANWRKEYEKSITDPVTNKVFHPNIRAQSIINLVSYKKLVNSNADGVDSLLINKLKPIALKDKKKIVPGDVFLALVFCERKKIKPDDLLVNNGKHADYYLLPLIIYNNYKNEK